MRLAPGPAQENARKSLVVRALDEAPEGDLAQIIERGSAPNSEMIVADSGRSA